jgi:hypothetical protein
MSREGSHRANAPPAAMPRLPAVLLSVILAVVLHLDWHLARPVHHRLSLEWPHHWLATAAAFAIVGWIIARGWPRDRWQLGGAVYVAAVVLAQVVEPGLEVLVYEARLGYAVETERWAAFGRAMAAATPAYWGALWVCARRPSGLRTSQRVSADEAV